MKHFCFYKIKITVHGCTILGVGRGGKSSNIKQRTMADWEHEEYRRELESERIRNEQNEKT